MAFAASENGLHPRGPVDARPLEPGGFKRREPDRALRKSTSPTRRRAASVGTAFRSAFISGTSTIEVSSITRKSHSIGLSSLRVNPPCFGLTSKSR
jgi:hypothetical protein